MALTVTTRALGRRKPLLADFGVNPPPMDDGEDELTLRALITSVVRQEVARFGARQREQRFDRVLGTQAIAAGAEKGKIDPAGKSFDQTVEVDEAVGTALLAFEDGLYLVIIDGIEYKSLDDAIRLHDDSKLTFLRLTFLAGA
jgi:hypothetical protein